MSFRLIVRLPGDRGTPGYGVCASASDALTLYRRMGRARVRVEEILDVRRGGKTRISAPDLEAIAMRERYEAAIGQGGAP
jgi:hypothetical protein